MSERLLTIAEAATELGRRPDAVVDLIRARSLPALAVQPHGDPRQRLRVREAELDRWLRHRYGVDPADIRRRNREAFDRRYRASLESAARLEHKYRIHAATPPVRSRNEKGRSTLTAAETDRLHARKLKVEAAVCRCHARRARRDSGFFTTCALTLDDGTALRWRYWPATGRREYLPFEPTA